MTTPPVTLSIRDYVLLREAIEEQFGVPFPELSTQIRDQGQDRVSLAVAAIIERHLTRTALGHRAPSDLAGAWDAGVLAGMMLCEACAWPRNPYRKRGGGQ